MWDRQRENFKEFPWNFSGKISFDLQMVETWKFHGQANILWYYAGIQWLYFAETMKIQIKLQSRLYVTIFWYFLRSNSFIIHIKVKRDDGAWKKRIKIVRLSAKLCEAKRMTQGELNSTAMWQKEEDEIW